LLHGEIGVVSALAMPNVAQQLCLECGLCCNGVIFANGQLQPEDDTEKLRALGLKLIKRRRTGSSKSAPGVSPGSAHDRSRVARIDDTAARQDAGGTFAASPQKFSQPCAAFQGCQCTIYSERPAYCRAFECALLQQVQRGEKSGVLALRTIHIARKRAEKVRGLLRKLGSIDEGSALSIRFRRTSRRLQDHPADAETAEVFGDLTVAMHQLNVVLSREFYPDDTGSSR